MKGCGVFSNLTRIHVTPGETTQPRTARFDSIQYRTIVWMYLPEYLCCKPLTNCAAGSANKHLRFTLFKLFQSTENAEYVLQMKRVILYYSYYMSIFWSLNTKKIPFLFISNHFSLLGRKKRTHRKLNEIACWFIWSLLSFPDQDIPIWHHTFLQ